VTADSESGVKLVMTELVRQMQRLIANSSVTPSAVRGGRNAVKGVASCAIDFLSGLNLSAFVDPASFPSLLEDRTRKLASHLPEGARYWGRARKLLNIFLREASYNYLLRQTFGLGNLGEVLEIPLDQHVANGLRRDAPGRVPRRTTIIGLKPEQSAIYQSVAREVAWEKYRTYRANLDLWYWRPEKSMHR
jgi:hypothetical protein